MFGSRCALRWGWGLVVVGGLVGCGEGEYVAGPNGRDSSPTAPSTSAGAAQTPAPSDPAARQYLAPASEPMPGGAAPADSSNVELRFRRENTQLGKGPGEGGDKYAHLVEQEFVATRDQPLSTFSIDVDTASYSKTRKYLLEQHQLPPVDAVRIEELVNYFEYAYSPPSDGQPFATHVETSRCPWAPSHQLARVALKGREVQQDRPACNLVFLIDVSGSMASDQKIGLVKRSLQLLARQLTAKDRVAIVVYASSEGLVLPTTEGDRREEILGALERLEAGGATNGGAGIALAYSVAKRQFIQGGVNRVLLCTDGDFNVGVTSTGDLVRMAETEAKSGVFLTVLGFGMGNHNDAMLEELSNKANGAYAYIDSDAEARKVFVDQIEGTLVTIAKDVKIQIEFNPRHVAAYRLIGYENRMLQAQDFNNDRKDAGEIGAGHTVTALYELVPPNALSAEGRPQVDPLRYGKTEVGKTGANSEANLDQEWFTLKVRYKAPDSDRSELLSRTVPHVDAEFSRSSEDFRFAASVAAFGMLLRNSPLAGDSNYDSVLEIAGAACGSDQKGYRREFLELVRTARQLAVGESPKQSATSRRESPVGWSRPPIYSYSQPQPNPRVVQRPPVEQLPAPAIRSLSLVSIGLVIFVGVNGLLALAILMVIGWSSLTNRVIGWHVPEPSAGSGSGAARG